MDRIPVSGSLSKYEGAIASPLAGALWKAKIMQKLIKAVIAMVLGWVALAVMTPNSVSALNAQAQADVAV